MIGPFPWWYGTRGGIYYQDKRGFVQDPPHWDEENRRWRKTAWRLMIPPEWRFRSLENAPIMLKLNLGLINTSQPIQTSLQDFFGEDKE